MVLLILLFPVTLLRVAADDEMTADEAENWSFVLYNNYSGMP